MIFQTQISSFEYVVLILRKAKSSCFFLLDTIDARCFLLVETFQRFFNDCSIVCKNRTE